jgi:hypothetical protein
MRMVMLCNNMMILKKLKFKKYCFVDDSDLEIMPKPAPVFTMRNKEGERVAVHDLS